MKYLIIVLIGFAIGSCRSTEKKNESFESRLDSLMRAQVEEGGPGGTLLIAKEGKTAISKSYGIADLVTKEPITSKTLFNLGSISKTFVANAILILATEGKLSLEDPLVTNFPDFKNKDIARKVKIKHLLTHTSGLPDNREVSKDTVFYLTAKDAENWYPVTQADSLLFEPGSRYEYSNPAFNGLALIIEKVSGMKWQQFITARILQPASMSTSTITDGAHPQSGVAHGYSMLQGKWSEDDYGEEPTFPAAGNGGVWSSTEELLSYEIGMQNEIFLPDSVIRDSRTAKKWASWSGSEEPFIGWSWFIEKTKGGLVTVGHTGTQGGFYCNYVTVPEKKIIFIMLFNFPCEREMITEWVLTNLAKENWLDKSGGAD